MGIEGVFWLNVDNQLAIVQNGHISDAVIASVQQGLREPSFAIAPGALNGRPEPILTYVAFAGHHSLLCTECSESLPGRGRNQRSNQRLRLRRWFSEHRHHSRYQKATKKRGQKKRAGVFRPGPNLEIRYLVYIAAQRHRRCACAVHILRDPFTLLDCVP